MSYRLHKSFRFFLPVLLLLPLAITSLDAQTPGGKKIDPCAILTRAEIQEALGKPVQEGKLNTSANAAVGLPCQYVVADFGAFSVLVKTAGPGETADSVKAGLAKSNIKTADAPGVGDKSFFSFPGYGMVQLNTFKGTQYIIMTILVPGLNEDALKAPAQKLMQKALAKL